MAEFTEKELFEAFGLPADGGQGGKEQDGADPAPKGTQPQDQTGGKEQEPADPAETGTDPSPTDEGGDQDGAEEGDEPQEPPSDGEGDQEPGDKPPLTPEQRREKAAERRRAETQEAINKAVQEARADEQAKAAQKARADTDAMIATMGLKNTITGEPITSLEEYQKFQQDFAAAKLQRDLKAGKLTPESLEKVISDLPAVKNLEKLNQQREAERQQQDTAKIQAKVDEELAEIHKLDPSISTVQDLLKMPKAKEFYGLVKAGNSFLNAFKLSHFEELQAKSAEAAKQKALNDARSKDHLAATAKGRGAGAVSVPAEDMAYFRALLPGATEAEIQEYSNTYMQK